MDDVLQKKLASIIAAYTDALPSKLKELEDLATDLVRQWDKEEFANFYRKVHSLRGSAGMYGYKQLSQVAQKLEIYLKSFINKEPTPKQWHHIDHLLEKLVLHSHDNIHFSEKISPAKEQPHAPSKVIYMLEKDSDLVQTMILQLGSFGYLIKAFEDVDSLITQINKLSNALAIIIDISFLTIKLETALEALNLKKLHIPVFFMAETDDFEHHLQAVRAGGQGYFTSPVQIEEIIAQLEELFNEKEPYHILIVEDDEDTANFYQVILQQAGMDTKVITQPSLIDKVLSDYRPDLILMDIYMPGCSGLELAAIIRQRNIYASIPIVFLSSEQNKQVQLAAMSLGGDDFIDKSIKPEYLISMVKNRAARYEELRSFMVKDGLTGVLNHSAIYQKLDADLKLAHRLNIPLSVVMIDVDQFKKVNDTYGHRVGDQVLKNLSVLMQTRLRKTDTVGRYGGEEFLVILPNTSLESSKKLIEEMREQFSKVTFFSSKKKFQATFSAGITSSPPYMTVDAIIQTADQAMYEAKKQGRNKVMVAVED